MTLIKIAVALFFTLNFLYVADLFGLGLGVF
mgnify:CR=1 FL=1